jgi:superfamily II DNA or RNA helicase
MASPAWRAGASVRVRGRRWRIESVEEGDDCIALRLADLDASGRRTLTILTPFDRPCLLDRPSSLRIVRARRCLHEIDRSILDHHPFGSLAHLAGASVAVMPYQLEPALAMLRHGRMRVLIADGVGLGKTIQAGIVMLELSATDSCRALVLTPAGLREQWRRELDSRFHLATLLADADWLRHTASDLPAAINPWSLPGIYVASFDFVKRPEALRPLEEVAWDLVVVDEAHAVSAGTDRRAAIHAIAGRAQRVLLLTATPPAWDADHFRLLCEIGRVRGDEPPPACFARTGSELRLRPPRRTSLAAVAPTIAEASMHAVLQRYSDRVWREATSRGDDRARLAAIVLRKRALSSAGSLLVSVLRRMDLLGSVPVPDARQLLLPLDDEDPLEDDDVETLAAPGLVDAGHERRWLAAIAETARRAARDESKTRWLLRLLRRLREPVTIFTEYRDTLARLERRIRATGRSLAVLHGGMDPRERAAVASALDDRVLTLLATDAAAEGLNLQHHSRIVVHYELPWNPARLEQRAGRVDRIGQTWRVHEIALISSTPAERLVLRPLAARAARAGMLSRFGSAVTALNESRVAEAVMSGMPIESTPAELEAPVAESVECLALAEEAATEAALVEQRRALIARSGMRRDAAAGPVAAVVQPRDGRPLTLAVVYSISLETATGRRLHSEPVAATLDSDALPPCRSRSDVRAAVHRAVLTSEALASWLAERGREIRSRVEPIVAAAYGRHQQRRVAVQEPQRRAARRIVQLTLPGTGPPSPKHDPIPVDLPPLAEPRVEPKAALVAAILLGGPR